MRIGIMTAAGAALVVAALPQAASGSGLRSPRNRPASSGSCRIGSAGNSSRRTSGRCASGTLSATATATATATGTGAGTGTVTGTVAVTGAPTGFVPGFIGAGACPSSGGSGLACSSPVYALAAGGTYTLSLGAGQWTVDGFYEVNGFGGAYLGAPQVVTVPAGGTVTANFTVPFRLPATLKGKIHVTGVPSGIPVEVLSVLLCPSFAPYDGVSPSLACVSGNGRPSFSGAGTAPYQVTGLPPGAWTAYPGYCTQFGCVTNANAGKALTLVAGRTTRANLTTPFILPGEGLLTGTVTVTGAPPGFSDPAALSACPVGGGQCETFFGYGGNTITLLLADGQWSVTGFYLVSPFNNAVAGPAQTVTISGGKVTAVAIAVPYQVLGTAAGTIHVTGARSRVPIMAYTVLACPASSPWTGGITPPECVNEFSGPGGFGFGGIGLAEPSRSGQTSGRAAARTPFNLYQLPTLTPGPWILYPGYRTVFGSYTDPSGTTVAIAAGQTTTGKLTVPYQTPSVGVVEGKVVVVGAPADGGFQSGVRACSAPPNGTSCPNAQEAYNQSSNLYQLVLQPGTWWVSGFVDVFGSGGVNESTTQPIVVTVTAGSRTTEDFTVKVSVP
jgi:hypothetical protein